MRSIFNHSHRSYLHTPAPLIDVKNTAMLLLCSLIFIGITTFFTPPSQAAVIRQLPFSARLKTANGLAVSDGNYSVTFTIYTTETDGTASWSETQTVTVTDGIVSVNLGSVTAFPTSLTFNDNAYYLGIKVGSDAEMSPRKRIGSVPTALNADTVDGAHAGTSANEVLKLDSSGNIDIAGNITTSGILQSGSITASTLNTTTGNLTIAPAGGTTAITGNLTVSNNVTVGGLITGGSIIPSSNNLYDLGSSSARFANAYINNLVVGTTSTSGTSSSSFTLNDDATGDEDSSLLFYRGGVATSGQLLWNAATDLFNLNYGLVVTGSLTTTSTINGATLTSSALTPGSNFTLGSASYTLTVVSSSGNVDVKTPSTNNTLRIYGSGGSNNVSLTHNNTNAILQSSAGELQLGGTGSTEVIIGSVGSAANLVFEESSTISAQGGNTLTLGTSTDIIDLNSNTTGATYRVGTLTAPTVAVLNTSASSSPAFTINAASSHSGNLLDLQVNSVSKFSVTAAGGITMSGGTLTGTYSGNPTFSGNTIFSNTGTNALAITGAPTNSATSSLVQIGNAITGGNTTTDGGTYLGLNAPSSGPGSAADLLNLQVNGSSRLKVTTTGAITAASTINGVTLSSGTISNPTVASATVSGVLTGSSTPTITGFGTINGTTLGGSTLSSTALTFDGASPNISASTTDTSLTVNANGTGTITLGSSSTGDIRFYNGSNKITPSGNLTIAGTLTTGSTVNGTTLSGGSLSGGTYSGTAITPTGNLAIGATGFTTTLQGSGNYISNAALTSGTTLPILTISGATHTGLTASTESTDIQLNLARNVQFATGALTTQRAIQVSAPTYSFVGSSTITDAATFYINDAPTAGTNATITNAWALWIDAGAVRFDGVTAYTPSSLQTLVAATTISANATKVRVVGTGGATTLTSAPTILDGKDGQMLIIQGTDDTNTVIIQDQDSLASSNIQLGAASRTLGKGDILILTFDTTDGLWYEVSFTNN